MDIELPLSNEGQSANMSKKMNTTEDFGKRLQNARETARLSEKEAAARLHLSPRVIALIESEDFENGPPATFMRGYIRSYARMLSFPEQEIAAALFALEGKIPTSVTATVSLSSPILKTLPAQGPSSIRWMTFPIVIVLGVLVSMWWYSHPRENLLSTKPAAATIETNPAIAAPPAPTATTTGPIPTTNNATAPAAPAVASPIPPEPNTTATSDAPTEPSTAASSEKPAKNADKRQNLPAEEDSVTIDY